MLYEYSFDVPCLLRVCTIFAKRLYETWVQIRLAKVPRAGSEQTKMKIVEPVTTILDATDQ